MWVMASTTASAPGCAVPTLLGEAWAQGRIGAYGRASLSGQARRGRGKQFAQCHEAAIEGLESRGRKLHLPAL